MMMMTMTTMMIHEHQFHTVPMYGLLHMLVAFWHPFLLPKYMRCQIIFVSSFNNAASSLDYKTSSQMQREVTTILLMCIYAISIFLLLYRLLQYCTSAVMLVKPLALTESSFTSINSVSQRADTGSISLSESGSVLIPSILTCQVSVPENTLQALKHITSIKTHYKHSLTWSPVFQRLHYYEGKKMFTTANSV